MRFQREKKPGSSRRDFFTPWWTKCPPGASRLFRQSERCFRSASLIFSLSKRRRAHDSCEGNNPPMSRRNYSGFPSYIRPYVSVQHFAYYADPRRERRRHVLHVSRRTCAITHRRETRFSEAVARSPLPSFPRPTSTDRAESLSASPNWSRVCTRCISHRGIARQRSLNTEQARISLPNPKIPRLFFDPIPTIGALILRE